MENPDRRSVPRRPESWKGRDWPLWTILQWYGVVSLILIILFNSPGMELRFEQLVAWTLDSWVVALALTMDPFLFGLLTNRWVERSLGATLTILVLTLAPRSTLATDFFAGTGNWLVLTCVLLVGVGELMRFTAPRPAPQPS